MKKILMIICDFFTLAFLIGGYIVQYFTRKKLGMMRWINFNTYKYQEKLPLDILKYVAVVVVIIFTLLIMIRFAKKRKAIKSLDRLMLIIMLIVILLYVVITIFTSKETLSAYYFVMPLLGMAALVQLIKVLIIIRMKGYEEK